MRGDGSGQLSADGATGIWKLMRSRPECDNAVRGLARQMSAPRGACKAALHSLVIVLNQNLLDHGASVSSLVGESLPFSSTTSSSSSNNDVNEPTITHHETWGECTSHMAQLTSAALLYTTSVFWYAISNSSFR